MVISPLAVWCIPLLEKFPGTKSQAGPEKKAVAANDAPVLEALEARTLFSADLPGLTGIDPTDQALTDIAPLALAQPDSAERILTEVVFINSDVDDVEMFVRDIERQAEDGRHISVQIIDAGTDGIAQITTLLLQHQPVDAVHLISHGSDDSLRIGNTSVNAATLDLRAGPVSQWQQSLSADADILLYGCDLAGSEDGINLIQQLASLTGADIAASNDVTGHHSVDGDWEVEFQHGAIEAEIAISDVTQGVWRHDLAGDSPVFNKLGGDIPVYYRFSQPVVLDGDVTISVADESAAARYKDATVTLERNGGGNPFDDFNIGGNFEPLVEGGSVVHNSAGPLGNVVANSLGTLVVQFNATASTALVNEFLQSLTYQTAEFGFVDETRTFNWGFAIESTDGSGITRSTISQSFITASPVSAIANDVSLGEILSGIPLDVSESDLVSNDTVYSARPLSIVNTTDPVLGSIGENNGTLTYSSDAGATGTDHFDYTVTDGNPDIAYHWRMHTDMTDETGRNHGTVVNDLSSGPDGLDFNGNDYIVVPDFDYPEKFTLSFDFKVNDMVEGEVESFYRHGQWAQANSMHIYLSGGIGPIDSHIVTYVVDSTDYDFLHLGYRHDVSGIENDNKWHNYTLTREEGVGVRVYIDGVEQPIGDVIRGENAFNPAGDITVGAYEETGYLDDSEMRDLRVYSTVLSQEEIEANESNRYSTARVNVELRNEETVVANGPLTLFEGQSREIDSTRLKTTDPDLADGPENIVYTIANNSAPTNGWLQVNTTVLSDGSVFTQKDINDRALTYTHNGSETVSDEFEFTVDDGKGTISQGTFQVNVEPVNDAPTMTVNTGMIVTEGNLSSTITAAMLAHTDDDDTPDNLVYQVVSPPAVGALVLSTDPVKPVLSFTQQDINAGRLIYRHDGSEAPSADFAYELRDGGEDGVGPVSGTFSIAIDLQNDAPVLTSLNGAPVYSRMTGPVVLDSDVTVADAELDQVFGGDYNGTTLTLQRSGGASGNDVFSATGVLDPLTEGGAIVYDAQTIGAVAKNSEGVLQLAFESDATGALVNGVMRSIAYSHPTVSPPDLVQIDWIFSDGNTGDIQGAGGALSVNGMVDVTIEQNPEFSVTAPVVMNLAEDDTAVFSGVHAVSIDDGLLADLRYQVTLYTTNGGTIDFGDSTDLTVIAGAQNSDLLTVAGTESALNAALNTLQFTPATNSGQDDSIVVRLAAEDALLATYKFDGDASDSAAAGKFGGSLQGGASFINDPIRGDVLSLVDSGQYVDVPGVYGKPDSVTLTAWVNLEQAALGGAEIITLGNNVILRADNSTDGLGVKGAYYSGTSPTGWEITSSGTFIENSGWRHLAYSIDSSANVQRLYIDGAMVSETTFDDALVYDRDTNTRIGAHSNPAVDFGFTGKLDDARVYGKALSADEVRWLARDQLMAFEKVITVDITAVNDPPAIVNLDTTPIYTEGGSASLLDSNVMVTDPELDLLNTAAGAALMVQRAGAPDADDVFTANVSSALDSLVEGADLTLAGKNIGSVVSNSSGVLWLQFNSSAELSDVNGTLQALAYSNSSVAPPSSVELEWTFVDSDAGTSSAQGSSGPGVTRTTSTVDITPVNSSPVIALNRVLDLGTGAANQIISRTELSVDDIDNSPAELEFTLNAIPNHGTLSNDGTPLSVDDKFTQQDINESRIAYSNNGTAGADSFQFGVSDGIDAVGATFVINAINDLPSQLSAGLTINRDGGNDTYLYDISNFNHVVGDSLQTWEFIFSGVQPRNDGGDNTLYSAATTGAHSNHLAIKPNGEVEWYMQGWPTEGLSSGAYYFGTADPIPDLLDGKMHSIAIVFDLTDGGQYYKMYIDGKLANEVPSGWDDITINLTADFPFVLGQKLESVDSHQPTDPDSQLHFVPGDHFSGTYHDVRVWDSIRTDEQLNDHRFARFDVENAPLPPDLQINWQFDSLNGNDTVVNATARTGDNNQAVTLTVKHVNDPRFTPSLPVDVLAVDEDAPDDTIVGYVMPRDPLPDANGYTYELLDNADGAFAIDANTGQVSVADSSKLNFDTADHHDLIIRIFGTDISGSAYSEAVVMEVRPINAIPVFEAAIGNSVYVENEPAVVLEPTLAIFDQELSAGDNFDGASLLLSRSGVANTYDQFLNSGDLGALAEGSPLRYGGVEYGTVVQNNAGQLELLFNSNAKNSDVNAILSSIAYRNFNDNPPPMVQLEWTIADGNVLEQGAGGIGTVSHNTVVSITAANDAPSIKTSTGVRNYTEGEAPIRLLPDAELSDPELAETNYSDATLSIFRDSAAGSNTDIFSASGLLGDLIEGGYLKYDNQNVGLVLKNSAGALKIEFDAAVDGAAINDIARSITYSNSSNTPASMVDLLWTFNDQNSGDQGIGPAQSATFVQSVQITPTPDAPVLMSNALTIIEGQTLKIDSTHLRTNDVDTADIDLEYDISAVTAGHFAYATLPTVSIQSFTQQQINDGEVVFVHDGSEIAPSYIATVGDGVHTDSSVASVAYTAVNDLPITAGVLPARLAVLEDVATEIPLSALSIADSDAGDLDVTVIIETATGGLLHTTTAGALTVSGNGTTEVEVSGRLDELNTWLLSSDALSYTGRLNANGTALDTITVTVFDNGNSGIGTSSPVSAGEIVIDILPVNDEPSGADATVRILEDQSHTFAQSDFGFVDAIDNHAFFGVIIENTPSVGLLTLSGFPLTAGEQVSVSDIQNGQLLYTPLANESGDPYTTVDFRVVDSGGDRHGGSDTDSSANRIVISVDSVSDRPYGHDKTVTLVEDGEYVFAEADFGFYDNADGDVLKSIIVSTVPEVGALYLSGEQVGTGKIVGTSDIVNGRLAYQPPVNVHGKEISSFEFLVQDSGSDNNTAFSANRLSFDVLPVGDAPSGADAALSLNEDATHTFTADDFGFSDITDNDDFFGVRVASVPAGGSLQLNGNNVTPGDTVSIVEITAGSFTFTPEADAHGDSLYAVSFHVIDDGITTNGGQVEDPVANTVEFSIKAINDAPNASSSVINLFEDSQHTFAAVDFGFDDPADGHDLAAVKIIETPHQGSLRVGAQIINDNDDITVAQINAGEFTYSPEQHGFGPSYARLVFHVQDNGGTADGGVNVSEHKQEIVFNVKAVSDAPIGTDHTLTVTEDVAYAFSVVDFGFSDSNDGNTFTGVTVSVPSGPGSVLLNGRVILSDEFVDSTVIETGQLFYLPGKDSFGPGIATIAFRVHDDGSDENGGENSDLSANILTIDVIAANDSPQLAVNAAISVREGGTVNLDSSALMAADVDDSPDQLTYTITDAPDNGVLYHISASDEQVDQFTQTDVNEQRVSYRHNGGEGRTDQFSFLLSDASGLSQSGVAMVNIDGVADAPVGRDGSLSAVEDEPYVIQRDDFGFSDIEGDNFSAIISTDPPVVGSLFSGADPVSADPVSAGEKVTIETIDSGELIYRAPANLNGVGVDRIGFRVVDDGDQVNATGSNVDAETRFLSVDVKPVNDAPTGVDTAIEVYEDRPYVFSGDEIGFADSADGNKLFAVVITELPGKGDLWLNGELVTTGQTIQLTEIKTAGFTYLPTSDVVIGDSDQIRLRVVDDGGSDNGGNVDTSTGDSVIQIQIRPVNSAPVATSSQITIAEDSTRVLTLEDFAFTDGTENHGLADVEIIAVRGTGFVTLDGELIDEVTTVSATQISSGGLRYTPVENHYGVRAAEIDYRVRDQGGVQYGGHDMSHPVTLSIEIESVNDLPVAGVFGDQEFPFSDGLNLQLPHNLFTDPDDDALLYRATLADGNALPDWLVFDPGSLHFNAYPDVDDVGTISIRVTATDAADAVAELIFDLTIQPPIALARDATIDAFESPEARFSFSEVQSEAAPPEELQVQTTTPVSEGSHDSRQADNRSSTDTSSFYNSIALSNEQPDLFKYVDEVVLIANSGNSKSETRAELTSSGVEMVPSIYKPLGELFQFDQQQALGNSSALVKEFDDQREKTDNLIALDRQLVGGTIAVTSGLSIGYIIWLVRGGLLLSSVLTSMPAWRWVDPLPVLSGDGEATDEQSAESLRSMIESSEKSESATADANDQVHRSEAHERQNIRGKRHGQI